MRLLTKICCALGWHERDEVVELDTYDYTSWRVTFCRQCGTEIEVEFLGKDQDES